MPRCRSLTLAWTQPTSQSTSLRWLHITMAASWPARKHSTCLGKSSTGVDGGAKGAEIGSKGHKRVGEGKVR